MYDLTDFVHGLFSTSLVFVSDWVFNSFFDWSFYIILFWYCSLKSNGCSRKLQLWPHRLRLHQTDCFWRWSVAILTKLTAVGVVISKVFEKLTEIPPTALYIFPHWLSPWQVFCITLHLTRPHICHRLAFSPNQAQIDCNRSVSLIADNPSLEIHMLSHHQPPPPLKK